ncbi:dipeptidase, partial [candidate division KSB1 bacterium]|nr:dipeptidase [candidate division KSB1 bacterium]
MKTFFYFLPGLLLMFYTCTRSAQPSEKLVQQAARLHAKILTLDSHVDTPLRLLSGKYDLSVPHDPCQGGGKVDFPRMRTGGLDAIFFAAFIGQGPRDAVGNTRAEQQILKIIDIIHQNLAKNDQFAALALTPDDAYRLEKQGKRAIFIGIENGYAIGADLNLIEKYYQLGARYITLCHTKNNDICDSSTDANGPEHQGLSEFGRAVVAEMNRIGMVIDVSHISDAALDDVLEVSRAPIVASHSCARALCDNPRNLDDQHLQALAKKDGVIQMCILSAYVKTPAPNPERDAAFKEYEEKYPNYSALSEAEQQQAREAWHAIDLKYPQKLAHLTEVIDHIDHIVQVAGIDHVGIGTDFDGGGGVEGCFDVAAMGNITLELVQRGYS